MASTGLADCLKLARRGANQHAPFGPESCEYTAGTRTPDARLCLLSSPSPPSRCEREDVPLFLSSKGKLFVAIYDLLMD